MTTTTEKRRCNACRTLRAIEEFPINKGKTLGRVCKACGATRARTRYRMAKLMMKEHPASFEAVMESGGGGGGLPTRAINITAAEMAERVNQLERAVTTINNNNGAAVLPTTANYRRRGNQRRPTTAAAVVVLPSPPSSIGRPDTPPPPPPSDRRIAPQAVPTTMHCPPTAVVANLPTAVDENVTTTPMDPVRRRRRRRSLSLS